MGPAVPAAFPPFNTRPVTLNSAAPVTRLTLADPVLVTHGSVPLLISLTTCPTWSVITATGPGSVLPDARGDRPADPGVRRPPRPGHDVARTPWRTCAAGRGCG